MLGAPKDDGVLRTLGFGSWSQGDRTPWEMTRQVRIGRKQGPLHCVLVSPERLGANWWEVKEWYKLRL